MNRIILISLIALIFNTGCDKVQGEKQEDARFWVTNPLRKDTMLTREYVCQIKSIQHIEIRALEKGYLQQIYVDEGQHVKKGQLMFQIMPVLYKAEKMRAEAEARVAEIEYLNTQALADSNVVSQNELALARARYDKAKAELALADAHLSFTEIRAPFDGIMDRFHVRLGSLVDEGELLTSLSDNSKMWVYFNVPEAEYLDYSSEQSKGNPLEVNLLMANNKLFKHAGKVETIEADFNNETGNIAFRATFPNPDGLLRHGETGNVQMEVPVANALLVPQKTTFEVLDKHYVFVVDDQGKVTQRQIGISAEMPDLFAVDRGLSEKDHILLEGLRKVHAGDKIHYQTQDPKHVLSNLKLYAE